MNALSILDSTVNVGKDERTQSIISGATFLISALTNMKSSPKLSIAKSVLGGYLLYRGLSGHCHINQLVDKTTAREF